MKCVCERPTSGAWLCDRCQGTLAIAIANIAAYYADLETVQTKRARYGTGAATKGSIGKVQPLPIDNRFADVAGLGTQVKWDAWNTVTTWCRTVMEEQPELHGPVCGACLHLSCAAAKRRRWPAGPTMQAWCLYLDRQFRWIVSDQSVTALLGELLDVERRLRKIVDRPADKWYAGKCSAADDTGICTQELYAAVDRGSIDCPACDTRHDVGARREFLLREAKDYLVTATEAAGALLAWTDYDGTEENLIKRIGKWRERERLTSKGDATIGGKTRPLYRLGDIQSLMVADVRPDRRNVSAS